MSIKKSWRTSLFGTGGLVTVLISVANSLMDGNPATNPDWGLVLPAIMASIGLLFSRDDKVSSIDVGINKNPETVPVIPPHPPTAPTP